MGVSSRAWGVAAMAALAAVAASPSRAQTIPLLTNGNFESGTFAGWTVANVRDAGDTANTRNFYIDTPGTTTPPVGAGGTTFATAPNPTGGAFYAVSTSDFPGQSALLQNFTVPDLPLVSVTLSFQLFVNDQSGFGGVVDSSGLDYTTGGTFDGNQHARVDLLPSSAGDFATAPAAVIRNFYLGADGTNLPAPFVTYSFDITANVARGGTYRLRFAEVDNLSALNVGVDNVAVTATIAGNAPEPSSLALTAVAAAALLTVTRRRARRRNV